MIYWTPCTDVFSANSQNVDFRAFQKILRFFRGWFIDAEPAATNGIFIAQEKGVKSFLLFNLWTSYIMFFPTLTVQVIKRD